MTEAASTDRMARESQGETVGNIHFLWQSHDCYSDAKETPELHTDVYLSC